MLIRLSLHHIHSSVLWGVTLSVCLYLLFFFLFLLVLFGAVRCSFSGAGHVDRETWGRWNHFLFSLNFIITQQVRRVVSTPPPPQPPSPFCSPISVLYSTLTLQSICIASNYSLSLIYVILLYTSSPHLCTYFYLFFIFVFFPPSFFFLSLFLSRCFSSYENHSSEMDLPSFPYLSSSYLIPCTWRNCVFGFTLKTFLFQPPPTPASHT